MPKPRDFIDRADPSLRQILIPLYERIESLEGQIGAVGTVSTTLTADLNAGAHRLTNLAEASAGTDAPTWDQVKKYVQAVFTSKGL